MIWLLLIIAIAVVVVVLAALGAISWFTYIWFPFARAVTEHPLLTVCGAIIALLIMCLNLLLGLGVLVLALLGLILVGNFQKEKDQPLHLSLERGACLPSRRELRRAKKAKKKSN